MFHYMYVNMYSSDRVCVTNKCKVGYHIKYLYLTVYYHYTLIIALIKVVTP